MTKETEKRSAIEWLDNVWYHYKVTILIVLFLTIVVVIATVQMCSKPPEADFTLIYAGAGDLHPTSSNQAQANIAETVSLLMQEGEDKPLVDVYHYRILTGDYIPNPQGNQQNKEALQNELDLANGFIFLLDKPLFDTYTKSPSGDRYVMPVASYLPAGSTAQVTEDGYGVYLHSLPLGEMAGFSELPEDTILCLRVKFTFTNMLGSATTDTIYPTYEALFRKLLGV